jgi:hypothetical protein
MVVSSNEIKVMINTTKELNIQQLSEVFSSDLDKINLDLHAIKKRIIKPQIFSEKISTQDEIVIRITNIYLKEAHELIQKISQCEESLVKIFFNEKFEKIRKTWKECFDIVSLIEDKQQKIDKIYAKQFMISIADPLCTMVELYSDKAEEAKALVSVSSQSDFVSLQKDKGVFYESLQKFATMREKSPFFHSFACVGHYCRKSFETVKALWRTFFNILRGWLWKSRF